jgi:hypothetical protein
MKMAPSVMDFPIFQYFFQNTIMVQLYGMCLNELLQVSCLSPVGSAGLFKFIPDEFVRKNLASNLDRSPLMRSYGYASAGDRPTLFAIFPLNFVPFMQYVGYR